MIENINDGIRKEAIDYYADRYSDFNGTLTENGLIHYIRHQYTDYDDFLYLIMNQKLIDPTLYPTIKYKFNKAIETKFGLKLIYINGSR